MPGTCDPSDLFSLREQFTPSLRFALYRLLGLSIARGVSYHHVIQHFRHDERIEITAEMLPVIAHLDDRFAVGCHLSDALAPLLPPDEALLFAIDHGDGYEAVLDAAAALAKSALDRQNTADSTAAAAAIEFALAASGGLVRVDPAMSDSTAVVPRRGAQIPANAAPGVSSYPLRWIAPQEALPPPPKDDPDSPFSELVWLALATGRVVHGSCCYKPQGATYSAMVHAWFGAGEQLDDDEVVIAWMPFAVPDHPHLLPPPHDGSSR